MRVGVFAVCVALTAVATACSAPTASERVPPTPSQAPRINVSHPMSLTSTECEQMRVIAVVSDELGITSVRLTVNDALVPSLTPLEKPASIVEIDTHVMLRSRENVIGITATNRAGGITRVTRLVRFFPVQANAQDPPSCRPERYAVVIGIGTFGDSRIPQLPRAERNARAVYDLLTTSGRYSRENVVLLTDTTETKPTLANLKRVLRAWLFTKAGRSDSVFLYYTGHIAPEVDASGNPRDKLSKYIVTRDSDPDSLFVTGFGFDDVETIFRRARAEQIVVAVDACFTGWSGGGRRFTSLLPDDTRRLTSGRAPARLLFGPFSQLDRLKDRAVITAHGPHECSPDPPDAERGLFTHFLLEGMQGAADTNNDKNVTIEELFDYVRRTVSERAQRHNSQQSPVMFGSPGTAPFIELRP